MDPATIKWLVGGLLALNASVLGWAVNYVIKSKTHRMDILTERQDRQDAEMKRIKDNYLSRFDKVYKKIDESRQEVMAELKELREVLINHLQK